ncbi:MAG TPA: hypothetical protein VFA50_17485 [Stellaceae bacterium]|nr:hypothetical protein [Stellaceae bacterium]
MNRIGLTAISAAFLIGAVGSAMAAGTTSASGNSAPATMMQHRADRYRDTAGDRYTQALNLLEAKGYTGIENFAAKGQGFTAYAWHNGKRVAVSVDPTTGQIQSGT